MIDVDNQLNILVKMLHQTHLKIHIWRNEGWLEGEKVVIQQLKIPRTRRVS